MLKKRKFCHYNLTLVSLYLCQTEKKPIESCIYKESKGKEQVEFKLPRGNTESVNRRTKGTMDKRTNNENFNDPQNTTRKTEDQTTITSLKNRGELGVSGRNF